MKATRREIILGGAGFAVAAPAWGAQALQAECNREAGDVVRLSWTGPAADVAMGTRPDGPFERLAASAAGGWTGRAPKSPRPYFRLSGGGAATEVAERLLPLQGGRNFRDLGGYRSADGRMVRWGQLYRSGTMVGLTDADYAYLDQLGVKVICDFRTTAERAQEPTRWAGPQMYTRDYEMDAGALLRPTAAGAPTADSVRAGLIGFYETMPYDFADIYRRMFEELVAGHAPLTFNCSGGKDRTGVAAGLLLTALGVPREQVLADYALTERLLDIPQLLRAMDAGTVPAGMEGLVRLPAEVRAPLMRSDPAYLQATLTALETREGSVDAFLDRRLGLGPAQVKTLRDRLLKPV